MAQQHAGTASYSGELESLRLTTQDRFGKRGRLWLIALAVLVPITLVGLFAAGSKLEGLAAALGRQHDQARITAVRAIVSDGQVLSATGFIEARERIHITSSVAGTIVELPIKPGMKVQAGDLIARLDDARYKAELDQAQAALDGAKSHLAELRAGPRQSEIDRAQAVLDGHVSERDVAQQDLDRLTRLRDTISASRHEKATAAVQQATSAVRSAELALQNLKDGTRSEQIDAAQAEVARAEAAFAQAQDLHRRTRIVASDPGTVLEKNVELGQSVRVEMPAASLCVLADTSRLLAVVDISERDLPQVNLGQHCEITTEAYPSHVYQGRVEWRSPTVNRQRGVVEIKVEILNVDEQLLPDMNCNVIVLREPTAGASVISIPGSCVIETAAGNHVFVLEEQRIARQRAVTLARHEPHGDQAESVEIATGLSEGEVVLVPGSAPLADGQEVSVSIP